MIWARRSGSDQVLGAFLTARGRGELETAPPTSGELRIALEGVGLRVTSDQEQIRSRRSSFDKVLGVRTTTLDAVGRETAPLTLEEPRIALEGVYSQTTGDQEQSGSRRGSSDRVLGVWTTALDLVEPEIAPSTLGELRIALVGVGHRAASD